MSVSRSLTAFNTISAKRLDADIFVAVSSDNRLKVWDVVTGQLRSSFTEPNHLSAQYTCVACISLKPAKNNPTAPSSFAALGTKSGSIVLWNLQSGEIIHRLTGGGSTGEGHSAQVNDVAFSYDGTMLYSCSVDKRVVCWSVATGEVLSSFRGGGHSLTRLCLSPNNTQLLVAGFSIKLFDLASNKVLKKFSGHATAVTDLAFSSDGRYFLSSASDRFLNLWSTSLEHTDRHPLHAFALDALPVHIQFHPFAGAKSTSSGSSSDTHPIGQGDEIDESQAVTEQKKTTQSTESGYYILGISESSTANIWSWNATSTSSSSSSSSNNQSKTASTDSVCKIVVAIPKAQTKNRDSVYVTPDEGAIVRALFVRRAGSSGRISTKNADITATDLLLARGSGFRPVFERVSYISDLEGVKPFVKLSLLSSQLLASSTNVEASLSRKRKGPSSEVTVIGPSEAANASRPANIESSSADTRKTKQPKLPSKLEESKEDSAAQNKDVSIAIPKSGSVQVVLSQALRAHDEGLIEQCINNSNQQVMKRTVDRLSTADILPLLTRLVQKFETKPYRAITLVPWIQEILTRHASFLLSVPNLSYHLGSLHSTVEHRLTVFKKLLTLSGRLDLMLSQVSTAHNHTNVTSHNTPLAIYDEDDTETMDAKAATNLKSADQPNDSEMHHNDNGMDAESGSTSANTTDLIEDEKVEEDQDQDHRDTGKSATKKSKTKSKKTPANQRKKAIEEPTEQLDSPNGDTTIKKAKDKKSKKSSKKKEIPVTDMQTDD